MTERIELARGRALVERWCLLAEQRLDHLTELFETGRWRRYFGEVAFLENIQEAKRAVTAWRTLLEREASSDNRPIDLSWLGQRPVAPRMQGSLPTSTPTLPVSLALPTVALRAGVSEIAVVPQEIREPEPAEPEPVNDLPWTQGLDPDLLRQRYPLLRNAM